MSAHSRISKDLGWEPRSVPIPDKAQIEAWAQQALAGDESAYYRLFEVNRFAPSPRDQVQADALAAVMAALGKARSIFDMQD